MNKYKLTCVQIKRFVYAYSHVLTAVSSTPLRTTALNQFFKKER